MVEAYGGSVAASLYQPIQFLLDKEKKKAVNLFLQTVGVFSVITVLMLLALFFKIL